jgi:cytochrome c peroxidase
MGGIIMIDKKIWIFSAVLLLTVAVGTAAAELTEEEELGKLLFEDTDLSTPQGQSCADCHTEDAGFTGPDSTVNALGAVYEGAVNGRFGNRKPPTSAYGGDSPVLYYDTVEEVWIGGMFWDGRATGKGIYPNDPLAEQAMGPFLNPLEQNNLDNKTVVDKVKDSTYAALFYSVCGSEGTDDEYYACIARSIAAYERSDVVNPFSSKYDKYLAGDVDLSDQEAWGLELFEGKANCANCHISQPDPDGEPPLFTDFTYDNLGIPKNPLNPFYYEPEWNPDGLKWVDYGLGGFLKSAGYPSNVYKSELGKVKVPTLRNVDKRPSDDFIKAYGHNGYFKSLKEIVHFYNTRDTLPTCASKSSKVPGVDCWPKPEVPMNVNKEELGKLGLTDEEEDAIVAFMTTLSDGYE